MGLDRANICLDSHEFARVGRDLALRAGEKIMEVYESDDFEEERKSDNSPVTRADKLADTLIFEGLRQAFPSVAIVTEEQAETHTNEAASFLIVDPLDGTKEFIARRGEFTVNIAYVHEGTPVLGIVYAPAMGQLYMTDGRGVALLERGALEPARPSGTREISTAGAGEGGLRVVASKSHRDAATDEYIARYEVERFASAGSSLKFCIVASGAADLYPRLGPTMEWDTAAGDAIVRAAGGRVLAPDGATALRYGKPGFANSAFIVARADLEVEAI